MIRTVEAVVDADGQVRFLGELKVAGPRRAVLDEDAELPGEITLLSQVALADDWTRPEEDAAWEHLQPAK